MYGCDVVDKHLKLTKGGMDFTIPISNLERKGRCINFIGNRDLEGERRGGFRGGFRKKESEESEETSELNCLPVSNMYFVLHTWSYL